MTREKRQAITEVIDLPKAENYFSEYALADAAIKAIEAALVKKMAELRAKVQLQLDELAATKNDMGDKLHHFAITNPDLFKDKKSIDFANGTLGFRTGQPSVEYIFKKAADVIKAVKKLMPKFVITKTTETLDKKAIIAERDNEKVAKLFTKMGIEVVQEESFYIEPKTEDSVSLN